MIKKLYKTLLPLKQRNILRRWSGKLRLPFLSGSALTCNCCNRSFRRFIAKGHTHKRLNAECPNCGSLERTRLLLFFLQRETDLFHKPQRVLHFAPEHCLYSILKKAEIDYIDGDIDRNLATYVVDITAIPYPDSHFDMIICSHVLGHVKDQPKAIRELHRVLHKDGTALVMTRINPELESTFEDDSIISDADRLQHYGEMDAWRFHGRDFQRSLEQEGFVVNAINYREKLGPELVRKYSLGDGSRETIFYCSK